MVRTDGQSGGRTITCVPNFLSYGAPLWLFLPYFLWFQFSPFSIKNTTPMLPSLISGRMYGWNVISRVSSVFSHWKWLNQFRRHWGWVWGKLSLYPSPDLLTRHLGGVGGQFVRILNSSEPFTSKLPRVTTVLLVNFEMILPLGFRGLAFTGIWNPIGCTWKTDGFSLNA